MLEKFKVIISSNAFIRMITHVLRFGNEALEESFEVMGVCVGKIEEIEHKIHLLEVVPIQHGIKVSTGFTKQDIELFTQLNNEYQERNMQIVGWYLSRPGWGLDFTDITKQNHQFFQTEKNPYGFVIIFDHTIMSKEKEFGFKIFSLIDQKKTNDYHELSHEVEIPKSLNFYKWVQKFVEDSQQETPILIKELREEPLRELHEIPLSEEDLLSVSVKDYSDQIEQAVSGLGKGLSNLNAIVSETYETQLNRWISDISQGTIKGMDLISVSLRQLKNTVSDGLTDVQKFFKNTFTKISGLFRENITEYINKRVKDQVELKNEISTILNEIVEESMSKINEKIRESINPLEENIKSILTTLEEMNRLSTNMAEITNGFNNLALNAEKDLKELKNNIKIHIENGVSPFKTQVNEKFESLDSELKQTKDGYSEIRELLEKLQKISTGFKNLS